MKPFTNILSALLIAVFFIQLMWQGFVFVGIIGIKLNKHVFTEFNIGEEDQNLQTLSLSQSNFEEIQWNSKTEIITEGKLYDVVKQSYINGKYIFTVIADTEESNLQHIIAMFEKAVSKVYSAKILLEISDWMNTLFHSTLDIHFHSLIPVPLGIFKTIHFFSLEMKICSPPPELS